MRMKVLFFLLISSISSYSQVNNYFFGVNLDDDWNSLTNYSVLTYFRANNQQDFNYVVVPFPDEKIESLDYSFRDLNYEMFLLFEKDLPQPYNESLSEASPQLLSGMIPINTESQAQEVFYKTLRLFTKYFGAHDRYQSSNNNNLGAYIWDNSFRSVTLSYVPSGNKRVEFNYVKTKL